MTDSSADVNSNAWLNSGHIHLTEEEDGRADRIGAYPRGVSWIMPPSGDATTFHLVVGPMPQCDFGSLSQGFPRLLLGIFTRRIELKSRIRLILEWIREVCVP
jgi:hypothetical protein